MNENRLQTLDNFPRWSPWPARLLGIEPWAQKRKTPEEVTREYEHEKWGDLLVRMQGVRRPVSVEELDEWAWQSAAKSVCAVDGNLLLLSARESHAMYLDLVETTLKSLLPASAIVELGAGYGSVLLALAKRGPFTGTRFLAGEYTKSGIELIRRGAEAQHLRIDVASCDLSSPTITDLQIPPGAVIFTSYAAHYVPVLDRGFVDGLLRFCPRAVVHFEPCYEHCDSGTLLGLMRRRYIEVNDYNTNLVTVLRTQEQSRAVTLFREDRAVFGKNALLPVSILVWRCGDLARD